MEYIKGDGEEGCFLCRIIEEHDDRENLFLKRGKYCGIVMNRYPYNNGHLMVFPYRHSGALKDLDSNTRLEMMDLLDECVEKLSPSLKPDGFNVGINLGRAAGAGLAEHLHVHVVPRWNGDTNFMPLFAETKIIPQSLMDLYEELAPLF